MYLTVNEFTNCTQVIVMIMHGVGWVLLKILIHILLKKVQTSTNMKDYRNISHITSKLESILL